MHNGLEQKDDIASRIENELSRVMGGFGNGLLKAPVMDIDPDAKTTESMHEDQRRPADSCGGNRKRRGRSDSEGQGDRD